MKDKYIIINKTALEKRMEELGKISPLDRLCYDGMIECEERILKEILSQSTPLIPEIEKAYNAGMLDKELSQTFDNPKGRYISHLKLDI